MYPHDRLPVLYGGIGECINFIDSSIGHGIAANGYAFAVDHEIVTGISMGAIIGVGIPHIEAEMIAGVWIKPACIDEVKPLRGLMITGFGLRSLEAGSRTNRIGFKQGEFAVFITDKDFEVSIF